MKAEVVGVGTELLLGQIANTNAQRISQALATVGVDVHRHVAVGDNHQRMVEVLREAVRRADAVIVTGGLGPTPDDITREAIAELAGVDLVRDESLVGTVTGIFQRLGREMPESNLRQADLPQGAIAIPPEGTAPGFHLEVDGAIVFALPGVPWEMDAMLSKSVLPELRRRGGDATILSREILVIGLGESHTHELIADLVSEQTSPTIAYLAGRGQVRVRLTAKTSSEAEAIALIAPIEKEIRDRLGVDAVPGHKGLTEAVGDLLRDRGISVASAESLTGGLLGAELSDVGGSSDFFKGGVVAYQTGSKSEVLGVPESILLGPGAVSEEAAGRMAEAVAGMFDADLGLSTTGVAGPGEQEGKPVGTVFVGAAFGGRTEVRKVRAYGDRSNIRSIAVTGALDLARRVIASHDV